MNDIDHSWLISDFGFVRMPELVIIAVGFHCWFHVPFTLSQYLSWTVFFAWWSVSNFHFFIFQISGVPGFIGLLQCSTDQECWQRRPSHSVISCIQTLSSFVPMCSKKIIFPRFGWAVLLWLLTAMQGDCTVHAQLTIHHNPLSLPWTLGPIHPQVVKTKNKVFSGLFVVIMMSLLSSPICSRPMHSSYGEMALYVTYWD